MCDVGEGTSTISWMNHSSGTSHDQRYEPDSTPATAMLSGSGLTSSLYCNQNPDMSIDSRPWGVAIAYQM